MQVIGPITARWVSSTRDDVFVCILVTRYIMYIVWLSLATSSKTKIVRLNDRVDTITTHNFLLILMHNYFIII